LDHALKFRRAVVHQEIPDVQISQAAQCLNDIFLIERGKR
jgi:hypothetical protein